VRLERGLAPALAPLQRLGICFGFSRAPAVKLRQVSPFNVPPAFAAWYFSLQMWRVSGGGGAAADSAAAAFPLASAVHLL